MAGPPSWRRLSPPRKHKKAVVAPPITKFHDLVAGTHRPGKIVILAAGHAETPLRCGVLCAINAVRYRARIGGAGEFADAGGVTFNTG
jgi:hypothetical protein